MRKQIVAAAVLAALSPAAAFATTGYFAHGYGMKAKAMGGVGIALPQDALAAATNPAGMALVGNRVDIGVDWFRPDRGAEITGSPVPGLNGSYEGNGTQDFLIPEFGYNRMIRPDLALGVSVFGNGGMNTDYKTSPFGALGGQNPAGVDLSQLFIAPTIAYRMGAHAFGVSLNLAYQRFKAEGMQPFDNPVFSSHPGNVTNQGYDSSTGWGLRFGWTGQVLPSLTLGATYQTKTQMGKLDKYKGLFAEQGGFDIPENYGIGAAWRPAGKWTLAADIQRINYGDVASVGNTIDCLFAGACQLGADNGAGFGWQNTTAYKFGVAYEMSQSLTLRAGYVHIKQPIPQSQTFFNIVAPGVVENHLTAGVTWTLPNKSEVTAAYMHALEKKVNGQGSVPAALGGGEANLRMSENSLGIAWGTRF